MESAASGLLAGINAAALARGEALRTLPRTTAMGALAHYVSHADPAHYQPSNITHGIMEPLANPPRDKAHHPQRERLALCRSRVAGTDPPQPEAGRDRPSVLG